VTCPKNKEQILCPTHNPSRKNIKKRHKLSAKSKGKMTPQNILQINPNRPTKAKAQTKNGKK
jgi:hypothetical protein